MNKYDVLWNDATDLMIYLDEKYKRETRLSLDEYLYEYWSSLEPEERVECIIILEELSNTQPR